MYIIESGIVNLKRRKPISKCKSTKTDKSSEKVEFVQIANIDISSLVFTACQTFFCRTLCIFTLAARTVINMFN